MGEMKHQINRRGLRRYVIDTPAGPRAMFARSVAELPTDAGIYSVDRETRTGRNMSDSARQYRAEDRALIRQLRARCGEIAG